VTPIESPDEQQLVLSELLNHVLDKGVVITGDVTISVGDIDLIKLGLSVVITAVATLEGIGATDDAILAAGRRPYSLATPPEPPPHP
jgi:hypothetical protein